MAATHPVGHLHLADGTALVVRPIDEADADGLARFHGRLSDQTTFLRFFAVHPVLHAAEVERFTHVDHRRREAVVALLENEIVAVARFDRLGTHALVGIAHPEFRDQLETEARAMGWW